MRKPLSIKIFLLTLRLSKLADRLVSKAGAQNYDVVLCYHDVGDSEWEFSVTALQFNEHVDVLRNGFSVTGLDRIINSKNNGSRPRIAMTFDDGYKGVYENAYPILKKYNIPATVFIMSQGGKDGLLDPAQISELLSAGWIFGFHSLAHKDLTSLDSNSLYHEVADGKKDLEEALGMSFKYFAYPFGKYDRKTVDAIKTAGFEAAFTVAGGRLSGKIDNKYELNRITVSKYISPEDLKLLLTPVGIFMNKVFTFLFKVKDNFLGAGHE